MNKQPSDCFSTRSPNASHNTMVFSPLSIIPSRKISGSTDGVNDHWKGAQFSCEGRSQRWLRGTWGPSNPASGPTGALGPFICRRAAPEPAEPWTWTAWATSLLADSRDLFQATLQCEHLGSNRFPCRFSLGSCKHPGADMMRAERPLTKGGCVKGLPRSTDLGAAGPSCKTPDTFRARSQNISKFSTVQAFWPWSSAIQEGSCKFQIN